MIICNACYGQEVNDSSWQAEKYKLQKHFGWPDSILIDTGQTTIGIITAKKHQDTVKVYAILKNNSTHKKTKAFIYEVRQAYKWSEHNTPDAEPQYFFKHIEYLGQDKKPISKKFTIIKTTELK